MPLRVQRVDEDTWYVINGTPTDCVHLAITGLFDFESDMVVSGVNDGANLGDDVLYSGTVAAAIEGRFLGPADDRGVARAPRRGTGPHFATAARVARELVLRLLAQAAAPLDDPERQRARPALRRSCRASRSRASAIATAPSPRCAGSDPRGREIYWVGRGRRGAGCRSGH